MATQKPISTISYNSEAFLKEKLETWYDQHLIQAWQYICHKGEDGDKDHIHLRIEPNKKLDQMSLTELLREFVPGSDKPLGVRPWRPSKEEDWWLYVVHDKEYLDLKYGGGEKGEKLPYKWQDVKVSPFYDAETSWVRAKASLLHNSVNIAKQIQQGTKPMDLMLQGENPFMVNTMVHAIAKTDYNRLATQLAETQEQFSLVLQALDRCGLSLERDTKGVPFVVPVERNWTPAAFIRPDQGPKPAPERTQPSEEAAELLDLLDPTNFHD